MHNSVKLVLDQNKWIKVNFNQNTILFCYRRERYITYTFFTILRFYIFVWKTLNTNSIRVSLEENERGTEIQRVLHNYC